MVTVIPDPESSLLEVEEEGALHSMAI